MKILYAIQGTGNGHISRARDLVPLLAQKGELDVLVSGAHVELTLDHPIKYRFGGLGFFFGRTGGIDLWKTYRQNSLRRFWQELRSLPVTDYDLVISDFEPVSAWACKLAGKPCIGLSHQAAVAHPDAPKARGHYPIGRLLLNQYAPTTTQYGFHFKAYAPGVFTPVIRKQVRELQTTTGDYYTVYLPAYSDANIAAVLSQLPEVDWRVFSKHNQQAFRNRHVSFQPLDNAAFLQSLAGCRGVLCGAGFETPAEVLHLGKKLLVIPMRGQYEQHCNAAALQELGIPVIQRLDHACLPQLRQWIVSEQATSMQYPDATAVIIDQLLESICAPAHPQSAVAFG
ncbi:MAG: glycosyl transferase [Sphingobacteriales bacterium]|nr:MAG: glycosyl transferase [Sphingobacteriales bacterium]